MSIEAMRMYLQNSKHGAEAAAEQIRLLAAQKRQLAHELKLLKARQRYVNLKIEYWQAVAAGDEAKAQTMSAQARTVADVLTVSKP